MLQAQPTDWHHIWLCIKSFVEFLYYLAGIVICGAAVYAAQQVKLAFEQLKTTKEIATATANRESVKLASEHCRYYAEKVVPAYAAAVKKYKTSRCTFLDPVPIRQGALQVPAFIINNGDFGPVTYNLQRITAEQWGLVQDEFVTLLNNIREFCYPVRGRRGGRRDGISRDGTGVHRQSELPRPRRLLLADDAGIAVPKHFEALHHLEQQGCGERSRAPFARDAEDGRRREQQPNSANLVSVQFRSTEQKKWWTGGWHMLNAMK